MHTLRHAMHGFGLNATQSFATKSNERFLRADKSMLADVNRRGSQYAFCMLKVHFKFPIRADTGRCTACVQAQNRTVIGHQAVVLKRPSPQGISRWKDSVR